MKKRELLGGDYNKIAREQKRLILLQQQKENEYSGF